MLREKTISHEVSFSGKALQTGVQVKVICKPASPGAGIVFRRVDIEKKPEITLKDAFFSSPQERRSTLGSAGAQVQTVEHFLAALWALSIDNLIVDIDGVELPAMDGSAAEFYKILKSAGLVEQSREKKIIKIKDVEQVSENNSSIIVAPAEEFYVSYLIDYRVKSILKENFGIKLDEETFAKEIAPARTFCLKEEAEFLLKSGLGKGATLENTLVMGDEGPLGTRLRFPNEPVRHKVLDLVGDLYILGRPIIGKVASERSGHALNLKMIEKLYKKYVEA